ncbi:hypothetical protein DPMN_163264 [Dreissena polymorpha]|uniref:Uncharacterized protein n=1 Tax=Dreissena polymorpha TaxID=45954 RepID=A0A9D4IU97_DREPO|nr:hypothetical protein DPMN_163264 [Dreissena polymorpha]
MGLMPYAPIVAIAHPVPGGACIHGSLPGLSEDKPWYLEESPQARYGDHKPNSHMQKMGIEPGSHRREARVPTIMLT